MMNEIKKDAEQRMVKSTTSLKNDLSKLRTGRAHPSLLEHLLVSYYGTDTPLNQVANITIEDARMLSVVPWDKSAVQAIEKAILKSDLGLNPVTAGTVIRVPLPPLTEERRKELVKVVRQEGESARVSVRSARRDANQTLKDLLKDKSISEDDEHKMQDIVQKLTDKFITEIDGVVNQKEKELLGGP